MLFRVFGYGNLTIRLVFLGGCMQQFQNTIFPHLKCCSPFKSKYFQTNINKNKFEVSNSRFNKYHHDAELQKSGFFGQSEINLRRKYLNSKKLEQFASLEEKVSQKDQNPTFFLLSIAHSSYTFFYLPKLLFGKTREILWKN